MKTGYETAKGPIEIIEEGFHLLRLAPLSSLLTYYLGAAPFVLAVLFFWSDMSRGAFADERLPVETLGLALLFVWMKTWQALFARHLWAQLIGHSPGRLSFKRVAQIAVGQAILQPTGLFLIPLAWLLLFPIAWVYAFYQSVTALAGSEEYNPREHFRKAFKHAALWPRQSNYVVFLFKAFGLFVFLNVITGVLMIPQLLSLLLGIETVFVRSPWSFLNTTFFAAICALTYLCIDPVIKAVYVLRCFYGESRQTGEDLKAELRALTFARTRAALIVLVAALLWAEFTTEAAQAGSLSPRERARVRENGALEPRASASKTGSTETIRDSRAASAAIDPTELDHSIDQVLQRPEYTWRLPREKRPEQTENGVIARYLERIRQTVSGWAKRAGRAIEDLLKWLTRNRTPAPTRQGPALDWIFGVKGLIFFLVAIIVALLGVLLVQLWRRRTGREPEVTAEPVAVVPDLRVDDVAADQLPEDGWITLARDLLARGELRLALRAFYLASLAHLAQRNLVTIARYKSNRDYERELSRRAHALPQVMSTFTENVSIFDRIWYGMHEVNNPLLDHLQQNVEKIKTS